MDERELKPWQVRLQRIIYESDTPAGKAFDIALLGCILASILVVMLDSVQSLHSRYGGLFLSWNGRLPYFLPSNISFG